MFNMNINLKFLLCGAAVWLFPQYAVAQCAVTDCQQLGYTFLQKCDNGLKCPFGEYWACPKVEEKAVLGECTGYAKNCKIGDILNSDGICSNDKLSGKTPIGVVIYIGVDNCGQAVTLTDIASSPWAGNSDGIAYYGLDIPSLPNLDLAEAQIDYNSCGNTSLIKQSGNEKAYPAAWRAADYAPAGAPETKGKWCLPAAGVTQKIIDNYEAVNAGLVSAGGQSLNERTWYATSSEYNNTHYWRFYNIPRRELDRSDGKYSAATIRSVIEF